MNEKRFALLAKDGNWLLMTAGDIVVGLGNGSFKDGDYVVEIKKAVKAKENKTIVLEDVKGF